MIRPILIAMGTLSIAVSVAAQQPAPATKPAAPAAKTSSAAMDPGERVFNANCNRCHTAPEQIPPSIAGTVVRHMRVRASLSAADEKALLHYLAP
jgi:cytochrome c5